MTADIHDGAELRYWLIGYPAVNFGSTQQIVSFHAEFFEISAHPTIRVKPTRWVRARS
ncbi:MAG: hypothetical protein WA317_17975 [Mycobacterium sp.]|uniref:hypothetical protein n=1 Tax=Mycobacterium sp. TaxID=1785 RepID=UPI003CC6969B